MTDLANDFVFSMRMKTLLVFCQTRSFSLTQKRLNLSESAVSRHLSELEAQVHFELVNRQVRPYEPTAQAQLLAQTIGNQIAPVNELIESVMKKNDHHPSLRLGCLLTISRDLAQPILESLHGQIGNILVLSGSNDRLVQRLENNDLDVIVTSRAYEQLPNIRRHVIFAEPTVLMLPKNLAKQHLVWNWSHLQFCGLPFIRYFHEGGGKTTEDFISSIGLSFPKTIECDSTEMIMSMVKSGMGWTMTRPSTLLICRDLIQDIAVVALPNPQMMRRIYLITHRGFSADLTEKIVYKSLEIFEHAISPEIIGFAPWLKHDLFIGKADHPNDLQRVFPKDECLDDCKKTTKN